MGAPDRDLEPHRTDLEHGKARVGAGRGAGRDERDFGLAIADRKDRLDLGRHDEGDLC
jgi:hypothetical protein